MRRKLKTPIIHNSYNHALYIQELINGCLSFFQRNFVVAPHVGFLRLSNTALGAGGRFFSAWGKHLSGDKRWLAGFNHAKCDMYMARCSFLAAESFAPLWALRCGELRRVELCGGDIATGECGKATVRNSVSCKNRFKSGQESGLLNEITDDASLAWPGCLALIKYMYST